MLYTSTRDNKIQKTDTEAIIEGMSIDGGLFVPNDFPQINFKDFEGLSYEETATKILSLYFPQLYEDIPKIVKNYGNKFESEEIAPIKNFDNFSVLELYHGPTASFKDMALTLLPGLMRGAYDKENRNEKILILTATSGDTGSAALEGFKDQDRTEIAVFYPDGGVSEIQKIQMESSKDKNAHIFSIKGNFDDAQRSVKEIFLDSEIQKILKENNICFASANSINIARLISQISYYVYAYNKLVETGVINEGEKIDIIVPTGNFGDILAGIYGKYMGVPIENAICASNSNNILTDFINTGVYDTNREFLKTISPSMDILVSSNLERFLYEFLGRDSKKISALYEDLKKTEKFEIKEKLPDYLKGIFVDDKKTMDIILEIYEKYNYLIDPHTAVAFGGLELCENYGLIVSTASPYKFSKSVLEALGKYEKMSLREEILKLSEISNTDIPKAIEKVFTKEIETNEVLELDNIKEKIIEILER